jgi:predicted RNase H-like HicB family nuclease
MKFPVLLEVCEEGGYTITCPAMPGCISEADTYEEALENIKDAIVLYLRAVASEMELLGKQKNFRVTEVTV